MKVLVTGSSGYLGSIAVSHLVAKGCEVIGLDMKKPDGKVDGDGFRFYEYNSTDGSCVRDIFSRELPDAVLHFACSMNRLRNRKEEFGMDVGGSFNVLEAARRTPSVRKFVFSSSAAIFFMFFIVSSSVRLNGVQVEKSSSDNSLQFHLRHSALVQHD